MSAIHTKTQAEIERDAAIDQWQHWQVQAAREKEWLDRAVALLRDAEYGGAWTVDQWHEWDERRARFLVEHDRD